jgi:hypothetical protein
MNFYTFLSKVDDNLLKSYALERYKDSGSANTYVKPSFDEVKAEAPKFKKKLNLPSIESLPDNHYAKKYVIARKIPKVRHSELYFAEDYKAFVDGMGIEKDGLVENDPRLVIPFYDENKVLTAFQGRALGESKMRYITVKVDDNNKKLYGLERVKTDQMIYVTEGPIDSMFLSNAVSTADSNLEAAASLLEKSNLALVFDNEPRNKEIVKQIEKAIDNHFNVVIWPEFMVEKDINEMVLAGFSPDEIQDIIDNNTFVNLRAKMEFVNWKKT